MYTLISRNSLKWLMNFYFRGFGLSWVSDPPKSAAPGTYKVAIFTLAGLLLNGFDWLQKLRV